MGRYTRNFDWITVLLLICLSAFGLFLLLSIDPSAFWQQLIFLVIAIILLFVFSRIDHAVLWWFAPFGYVLGNIFLALSYLGPSIRGATRWIMIGGAQIQPSELSKPFFILAFAYFMTKYSPREMKNIPLHLILFLIPFLLVFKQPDLGSSIIYGSFWISMMLAGGLSVLLVGVVALLGMLSFPVLWHAFLPYQKDRILTFLNPAIDPRGAGYNAMQAMIAVGSGQLFGRGLGRGTQSHLRFLPEHHTDFIFATLIEELGFLGGILLLSLYAWLLIRIIAPLIGNPNRNPGLFIYSIGLFSMLVVQVFINAAMNMGIIPVTGITLPFVSYGGSSLLSLAIAFGLLWSLQRRNMEERGIAIGPLS